MCDTLLSQPTAGPICAACWHGVRPLVPPLCAICGNPVLREVCGSESNGPPTCCGRCRHHPPPLAMSRALGEYEGELRAIIHALKYGGHRSVAVRLSAEMRAHCRDVLDGADAVVPVPLHWRRYWQRGFNQATLLASRLGPPVWPALRRVRFTRPQVGLPAPDRRRNLRGAFALARGPALPASSAWRLPGAVVGRLRDYRSRGRLSWTSVLQDSVVVLVDDVATTGSTLEACWQVLAEAGAREVRVLTAARVPGQR